VKPFVLITLLLTVLQSTPPKGGISGVVVRAGTGEPIPRAQITITRVGGAAPRSRAPAGPQTGQAEVGFALEPNGIPAVTTNDQGKFQVLDLDPGSYRVVAARNGFIKQEYGQRTSNGPGSIVTVVGGQQRQDVTFRLTPAPTISGRVVDGPTGDPLPGITVQALRSVYDSTGKRTLQEVASDRTNDLGEYRLYWINPGRYYVSANATRSGLEVFTSAAFITEPQSAENQAVADVRAMFGGTKRTPNEVVDPTLPLTYYPGVPDPSRATPLDLQPGAELRADFNLARGDRFRIRGKVIDAATGRPPQGASVSVSPRTGGGGSSLDSLFGGITGMMRGNQYNSVTGEFEVRDVTPGSYWLQVMTQPQGGFPTAGAPPAATNPTAFLPSTTQVLVDVLNSDLENVSVIVSPGVSIAGRVRFDPPSNQNLGFPQLSLQPTTGGGSFLSALNGNVQPRADGTFTIERITPGEYKLGVIGLNPPIYVREARLDQMDLLQGVTITDRVSGPIEVVLSPNGGQIDGAVIGADQKPVANVQVILIPDHQRNRLDLFKTAVTNPDGRFTIRGITPGDYRLFSWEDLEAFAYFDPDVSRQYEAQSKLVHIGESSRESVEVRLIPAF
jgi:hypothetical protein